MEIMKLRFTSESIDMPIPAPRGPCKNHTQFQLNISNANFIRFLELGPSYDY